MSVTYGFYNSKDGDRRYDAIQMSSIFDGLIRDGIYQHWGTAMMVVASENMMITVGIGRAWFNHTWTLNDALLPLTVPLSEVILNRIDAVVLEVDARESSRKNEIKIVKGTPASNPVKPTMIKTNDRWQYPLAYIRVNANVSAIRTADITNAVGLSETPFVTAPLEMMSIDALIAQWGDQWNVFYEKQTLDMEAANAFWKEQWATWFLSQTTEIQASYLAWQNQWNSWYEAQTAEMRAVNESWKQQWFTWFYDFTERNVAEMTNLRDEYKTTFDDLLAYLQVTLSGDVATNLANQILELQNRAKTLEDFSDVLSTEYAVYNSLYDNGYHAYAEVRDSSGNTVTDDSLDPIIGRDYSSDIILDSNGDPINVRAIFVTK